MSDSLIEKARGYTAEWQNRLHLTDWSVKVGRGDVNRPEWLATSRTRWRDMIGSITFPADTESRLEERLDVRRYADLDREIEATVVHELLHIAWSPRISDLRDAIDETLGDGGRAPILSALEKAEEFAVNMMTRALLDQKYPPRGDEKSSESTTAILDRGNCPDCAHQSTPPPGSIVPNIQWLHPCPHNDCGPCRWLRLQGHHDDPSISDYRLVPALLTERDLTNVRQFRRAKYGCGRDHPDHS